MELAECCEMFEVIKDLGHYSGKLRSQLFPLIPFIEAVASGIFKQILTGISYLHMHGVCHRDLKPNNILVSKDGKIVKITDFNVSKFLDKTEEKQKFSSLSSENYKMWTSTGTIAFTAPEVFLENEYT
jgi:serine/threonine protein kinase